MESVIRGSDNFDTAGGNAVKAWVNFNGTGTVAIRASFNVSSITDNGTGDYTANFTTAVQDTNYAVSFGMSDNLSTGSGSSVPKVAGVNTTSVRVQNYTSGGNANDTALFCVSIFR